MSRPRVSDSLPHLIEEMRKTAWVIGCKSASFSLIRENGHVNQFSAVRFGTGRRTVEAGSGHSQTANERAVR